MLWKDVRKWPQHSVHIFSFASLRVRLLFRAGSSRAISRTGNSALQPWKENKGVFLFTRLLGSTQLTREWERRPSCPVTFSLRNRSTHRLCLHARTGCKILLNMPFFSCSVHDAHLVVCHFISLSSTCLSKLRAHYFPFFLHSFSFRFIFPFNDRWVFHSSVECLIIKMKLKLNIVPINTWIKACTCSTIKVIWRFYPEKGSHIY